MDTKIQDFYREIALLLEIDESEVNSELDLENLSHVPWDSLAVVSVIAIIDEIFNTVVDGRKLSNSKKLSDIINLIEESK